AADKPIETPEVAVAPDINAQTLNIKAKALKQKPLAESKASPIVSNDGPVGLGMAVGQSPIEAQPSGDGHFVAQVPNADKFDVASPQHEPSTPAGRHFEQQMASRWFVWIGAAAVALGGLLFVRYAAQHQLVPPIVRIIMGLALGGALVAAAEYLRRTKIAADTYIPAGLASGGVVTAFGSIYAAHALYGLLGPTTAFIGLGLVALGALALAMRQGPLIAAVGLVGSYLTPALVVSNNPQALGLFIYLIVILIACFAVVRKRGWDWLGYLSLIGGTAWALLWVNGGTFQISDVTIIGLFCFAMSGVATFAIAGKAVFAVEAGNLLNPQGMSRALRFALAGAVMAMLVLVAQVLDSNHDFVAMVFFALGLAGITAFGWYRDGNSLAAPLAAGLAFFIILSWGPDGYNLHAQNWPTIVAWTVAAILSFGLVGAAGYLRKSPDIIWAALAAAAPVLFFLELYALVPGYWSQNIWALLALSIAVGQVFLAWLKRDDELSPALLLGTTAILMLFAFDRWTSDIWLTLLIAGLALTYALLSRVFATRYIGFLAILLATIAELRLFLRHSGFSGNAALPLGMHWPLYGYGLPAIGFWLSSRILVEEKYRRFRIGFEGLSLGLVITLVSLEIRAFIGGDTYNHLTLLEMGAHICAWLGAAYGLVYRQTLYSSFISTWGARILLGASVVGLVSLNMLTLNPLVDQSPIEGWALLNSLTLAYLVPCILLGLLAQKMKTLGIEKFRIFIGGLALVSLLAFVTFELKFLFEGPVLDSDFVSDAESYAISFCWLALAVVFFIIGLRWQRVSLRYGGIGVMALALFKTFGYDLWRLGGLWQIASVMGIGLSLVGIGWLYARFMRGDEAVAPK
ncbi:MAG: DUF2339 domain-containing protein, partial [Aestuariivirga sp.]